MFHFSLLGSFGERLTRDLDGYVPSEGDGPFEFRIDHGDDQTHDANGDLTDYGRWWVESGFPAWKREAINGGECATAALGAWQETAAKQRSAAR
jgi:hypothetical protein